MPLSNYFKLHYWPGITCVWFILTFIISDEAEVQSSSDTFIANVIVNVQRWNTIWQLSPERYLMSVLQGHIYPLFPYISDTGTLPPESCVFGQMLNIGAAFMAICMYIRYRQVEFAINSDDIDLRRKWNYIAFWLGHIVCLGISMVGNFQETNAIGVHFVGAFMAFGIGGLYLIIQTRISFAFRHIYYKYPEYGVGRSILYLRIFLTLCFFLLFFSVFICGSLAVSQFKGDNFTWWTKEQGGFKFRLASTFSEWFMVTIFIAYTFTATKEFKSLEFMEINFKSKCINLKSNGQEMM